MHLNRQLRHLLRAACLLLWLLPSIGSFGQNQSAQTNTIDSLAVLIPALDSHVDFTVSAVPVQEFLRGLANQASINMNIDPNLSFTVSNNFNNVRVRDVLQFLMENYDLQIKATGNILNIYKRNVEIDPRTRIKIEPVQGTDQYSFIISQVPVRIVASEITERTGQNIVVTPSLGDLTINCFIKNMPLVPALEKIAIGNNFSIRKSEDGVLIFEPIAPQVVQPSNAIPAGSAANGTRIANGTPEIKLLGKDTIQIDAQNCLLEDIINILLPMVGKSYNFLTRVDDVVSVKFNAVPFEYLMIELFAGTTSTFKVENDRYRIGKRSIIDMEDVIVVQLNYRTIDSVVHIIPNQLKKEVDIKEYPDMNSLVLSGAHDRVNALAGFIRNIDQKIPVILIDVLIVDNKNSKALSTGITAGLSDKPTKSKGQIFPSVDMSLSSGSVNEIIDGLNGFGWVNLGKVKSNFYMTLKALEEDGIIELKSTPQLSTLNGHKAKMSIGNTEYYKEELNNIFGSVTTQSQVITTYKPVEAELAVTIRPIVDGNEEVTLDIKVEQSDFTDRISEYAPPGKVSRKFESLIRVKDQDMILLGGLEEKKVSETRTGLPLLSRIPVVKWIFTSRERSNSKSKLNIFIKPTILN